MKEKFRLFLVCAMLIPYIMEPAWLVNAASEPASVIQNVTKESSYEYGAEVMAPEPNAALEFDHDVSETQAVTGDGQELAVASGAEVVASTSEQLMPLEQWLFPQSRITLPNRRLANEERADWIAEYWALGGPYAFELEVVRLVNEARIERGLHPIQLDISLMMAARFYTQNMATFGVVGNWSHNVGPYRIPDATHGASANVVTAFGGRLRWNGGNAAAGHQTPAEVVQAWINSPGHYAYIISPEHRYMGAGTHVGGPWGVSHYMFLSDRPSDPRRTVEVQNGTGSGEFAAGETVVIRATIPSGHRFVRWEGPVGFTNENAANTTFTMPANAVTVQAMIELVEGAHPVTFDLNGGHLDGLTTSIEIMVAPNEAIGLANVPTSLRHDIYIFAGWQANGVGPALACAQVGALIVSEATVFQALWIPIADWEQLREHINGLSAGEHTIRLTQDITATGAAIQIPSGRYIRIESADASMQTLTQTNNGQRHFAIGRDAELILGAGVTLSGGEVNNTNNAGGVQVNVTSSFTRQHIGTFTMQEGSVIEHVHRTSNGGAVFLQGPSSGTIMDGIDITAMARFNLEGGILRYNSAPNGGAVHVDRGNSHMVMTGGIIENNQATNTVSGLNTGGGGVYVRGFSNMASTFIMSGGIVQGNESRTVGGGVVIEHGTFQMSGNATITDNVALANWANAGGGGVMLLNSTFTMEGGTISDNRNPRGAGIFIGSMTGGRSFMTMTGGTITDNTASSLGGGVAVGASTAVGTFTMSGGSINRNTSANGGGIHIGVDSMFMMDHEDARITNNQASSTGGGISQVGGTVIITDGTISHNTAASQGGGVRVSATAANAFTMTGGTISHNRANHGDGGGLFTTLHTYQSPLPAGIHYANVNIGANANFSHNTAGAGAFMPPSNAAAATNIAVTATRSGGFTHALNNLDINFRVGTVVLLHPVRFLDGSAILSSIAIKGGAQLAAGDIPSEPSREGYKFIGWARTPAGAAETLIGETITGAVDFYAVWQPVSSACNVIVEGQFANQEGANGLSGASWVLCDDGVLEVGEGFINWTLTTSPWNAYRTSINEIIFTGPITAGTSLHSLFFSLSNITAIEGLEYFDTSNVTDMSLMFRSASRLESLDLSTWDTSSVTNMGWMFANATQLTSLDVSNWDTRNVVYMHAMFTNVVSIVSLDLSTWDTSSVTNMSWMFRDTHQLKSLDVSTWDTSNVTNMGLMFQRALGLANLDVSNWSTSNVTSMVGMFSLTRQLTNLDVSNWDTSNVRSMDSMFAGTGLVNLDVSNWDTGRVNDMNYMFAWTSNLTSLDPANWNTSSVMSMRSMFADTSLTSLDLSNWNTNSVTDMSEMFSYASQLTSLDVSNWDTSSVTNMNRMFSGTFSLRILTLGENFAFVVQTQPCWISNLRVMPDPELPPEYCWTTDAGLPEIEPTNEFTGYWQNVGDGTIKQPNGTHVLTSEQLMEQFDGQTMADTWVWQPSSN